MVSQRSASLRGIPDTLLKGLLWIFLAGIIALFAVLMLRPAPETNAAVSPGVAAVPPEKLHGAVTVWSWNIAAKSLQRLVPDFNRKYPQVHVEVDMTGARMQARLMLSLTAGVGAPDVSQFE